MPTYEFQCLDCQSTFSERRSYDQAGSLAECPICDGTHTRKLLSAVTFISDGRQLAHSDSISMSASGGCACGGSCACAA
jgi:putative FmdB family regulatory protein